MEEINRALISLGLDWDPAQIDVVSYLEGGYSNENYRIRHQGHDYALRIVHRPQPFVDRHHESAWLAALPDNICVRPIRYDASSGNMLSPWLKGDLLIDMWQGRDSLELVHYLRTLHGVLPDAGRTYDLNLLMRSYGIDDQEPLTVDLATTCHNDLNPWNIIVSEDAWHTLDWEFVGYNDPLFDLVGLHQGLELPEQELPELSRIYLEETGRPDGRNIDARLQRCLHNFWLREYGWAHHQIQLGNDRHEIREQVQVALSHLRQ